MSPKGAILLHSPGRKPWVNYCYTFIEPRRGGTSPKQVPQYSRCKCRSYGAQNFVVFCFPRVSYRALPSFHPELWRGIVPAALVISLNFDALALDTFTASASKYLNYTKRKQSLRFLFLKPRRSLYKLRLKFVQTTRVVCTDYSWSLQKVLRTYKFKYAHSLK